VAQRLRYSVEQTKFRTGSSEGSAVEHVTISIGVAIFPAEARSKRDLLEAADAALYQAKAKGRNRVVFYSDLKSRKEAS
jgi:diguanylate cyclase (GGDEF)-like protein